MTRERPQLVRKALESAMALVAARKATIASPLHFFKISEVEKAFRFMQSSKNSGKIVLEVTADDQVQALGHKTDGAQNGKCWRCSVPAPLTYVSAYIIELGI